MIRGSKEKKLISFPEELVEKLNTIAISKGVSLELLAENALVQSLRAEEMGVTLDETVDTYDLLQIQRGSGTIQIPRSRLATIVKDQIQKIGRELLDAWTETGRWYGAYLYTLLGEGAIDFLEKDLLISWNLDEVNVKNDELNVDINFASFIIPFELTELLISYIKGVMTAFGYEIYEEESLRGLATLRFRKSFGK